MGVTGVLESANWDFGKLSKEDKTVFIFLIIIFIEDGPPTKLLFHIWSRKIPPENPFPNLFNIDPNKEADVDNYLCFMLKEKKKKALKPIISKVS